jgi:uncharacterized protein (DUF58 family)
MNPRRTVLTLRGRIVVGTGAVMAVAAWLFGIEELYSLALASGVLTAGALVWVGARPWDLQVTRIVHPARVAAGQEARVELAVGNKTRAPSPPVEARDPFDGGRRWARFAVSAVDPGEVRRSSYRLPSARRGVHRLGPLELHLTDPFGLAVKVKTTAAGTSLTVHPRYDLVTVRGISSHRDDDRLVARAVIGKDGSEFYMMREYVPGDDLRHVHWPSTARLDSLVIRQPENQRRGRVTVAADLRAGVADEASAEDILSATATVAMSALRAGLQVRVITTEGFDSGHRSAAQGPALLDGLAAARVHRPHPGMAPFRLAASHGPVVLVTTDRISEPDIEAALGRAGPTGTTLVVFETPHGAPEEGPPAGRRTSLRTLRVAAGASFATAWTRREQSWS